MKTIRAVMRWCDDYYMATACLIVGIPLLALIAMELICYIELYQINAKLALLGV